MAAKENRAITKRVFDALGAGNLEAAQGVLAQPLQRGAASSAAAVRHAFPDMRVHLDDMVAEGDKVVARWTATGTHRGQGQHPFFGPVKPSGKEMRVNGITILRFQDGRVVETWGVTDELGAARQLGVVRKRA